MGDGVADGSGPVLIATKLRPPTVSDQVVARERLVERLRAGSGLGLSLVACPAGYGKTTLLAEWHKVEAARKPVAWLTLDEGDNDPVVLWSYVIEALRRACPAVSLPTSPQMVGAASIVHMVLPRLVNELDDLGEVALILDDFHRLSDGVARESLAWFVGHAPPTFQLVLSTRTEPDLPLAALRAHGELLELRADDLRFTSEEADAFLNGRLGLDLTPEDVEGLVVKTEGWPAGLYLAALSLRHAADRHAFVRRFGGSNRHVIDFLVTEVLQAHDPPVQALMLRTSILERLSGPLCDAAAGPAGLGRDARRRCRGPTCSSSRSTTKAGGTASTTCSPSCCGWNSSGATRAWPRRCTVGRTPGIVITGRPTRRSSTQ